MIGFDIETYKIVPDGEKNILDHLPLGISCAAAMLADGEHKTFFPNWQIGAQPGDSEGPMSSSEIAAMVNWLLIRPGPIVTFNGLGFDWRVIAAEVPNPANIAWAAMQHIDIMFEFFCRRGFPVSLESITTTMGLGAKAGMHGSEAPAAWRESAEMRRKVIAYVKNDADLTLRLALEVKRTGRVWWTTKKGDQRYEIIDLLTCEQCLQIPEPDTSWMSSPIARSQFSSWTNGGKNGG